MTKPSKNNSNVKEMGKEIYNYHIIIKDTDRPITRDTIVEMKKLASKSQENISENVDACTES